MSESSSAARGGVARGKCKVQRLGGRGCGAMWGMYYCILYMLNARPDDGGGGGGGGGGQ